MYRDRESAYLKLSVSAAVFVAFLFFIPSSAQGSIIPEKIFFQTPDLLQLIESDEIQQWFLFSHRIVYNSSFLSEITRPEPCPFVSVVCDSFFSLRMREHLKLEQVPEINTRKLQAFIHSLSDKIERDPVNAQLEVTDGVIVVQRDGLPGYKLNIESTFSLLREHLENNRETIVTLTLPIQEIPPVISAATLKEKGIRELISEGKTNFRGSPKNRVFNIKRALEQFNGAFIAPGEEFSFVDLLGPVDGENGYLPELVIKYNRTEPEFGGGICQVSTTVFRAALNAGLKITMRKNHAYPVQYYKPYGMDATIYIPRPDLRFINNTPGYILMIPTVNGTELTFSFFGTQDGRTVTIDGPHILERNPDGSMKTIFTQIVRDASGTTLIEDTFPSNYKSPDLFPHPNTEPIYTTKPVGWSNRQWKEYKKLHSGSN